MCNFIIYIIFFTCYCYFDLAVVAAAAAAAAAATFMLRLILADGGD